MMFEWLKFGRGKPSDGRARPFVPGMTLMPGESACVSVMLPDLVPDPDVRAAIEMLLKTEGESKVEIRNGPTHSDGADRWHADCTLVIDGEPYVSFRLTWCGHP